MLPGRWSIDSDDVVETGCLAKSLDRTIGDNDIGVAPFLNVLLQNLRAHRHILVGNDKRALGKHIDGGSRFATGCCTKVEVADRMLGCYLLEYQLVNHR